MQAGRLRHRLIIKQATEAQNTYGEVTRTWATLDTVWGSVEPLAGREYMDSKQVQATMSTRIRMRYRGDVTPSMRVCWGSHTYDVQDVIHDERRRELQLMAAEIL